MRTFFAWIAVCWTISFSLAGDTLSLPVLGQPIDPKARLFVFQLLPKSFQKRAELDMTVVCELTEYGKNLPQATPQSPVYYVAEDGGYQRRGEPVGAEVLPDSIYFKRVLERSLAANGFLPANDKGHEPGLVLIYQWGSHYAYTVDKDWNAPSIVSARDRARGELERARLIGGSRFAFQAQTRAEFGFPLLDRGFKNQFLKYQQENDLYFVVVSAYDFTALALSDERRLVWRARLTVNAQAVAMDEALPPLILTASPVFGRNMNEPEIVMRQLRRGKVTLAPLKVLEADVALPASRPSQ